jgi:hypothetical protein
MSHLSDWLLQQQQAFANRLTIVKKVDFGL